MGLAMALLVVVTVPLLILIFLPGVSPIGLPINEVLIFPEVMMCRNGKDCRNKPDKKAKTNKNANKGKRGKSTARDKNNKECKFNHGNSSLKRLIGRLSNAKTSVDVCVYTFNLECVAKTLEDLVKKPNKVKVRFISHLPDISNTQTQYLKEMAECGVEVKEVNPSKKGGLMHHKFAVIDKFLLINGSFNWTASAVQNNHENVVITDNILLCKYYTKEFERLWKMYPNRRNP